MIFNLIIRIKYFKKLNKMTNNIKTKQKGQALLFVVVAVTLALAVGVSVSTRTLNLLQRVSRTDTSQRVIAAAEGGIERLLVQTDQVLDSMETEYPQCESMDASMGGSMDGSQHNGGECIIQFLSSPGDKITATAIVDSEKFKLNGVDNYWFNLSPGYVKEVDLLGFTENSIEICWDNKDVAIYFLSYNCSGNIKKGGFYSQDFSFKGDVSGFTQKSGKGSYVACGDINLVSNPYGLRLRVLYSSSKIYVFPTTSALGSFPNQGYKITSKGQLLVENEVSDTKTIIVYRSFPYSPSVFDYAIYTGNTLR